MLHQVPKPAKVVITVFAVGLLFVGLNQINHGRNLLGGALLGVVISILYRLFVRGGVVKQCPFCAENVKVEAIVCRHCGRDLPALASASPPSREAGPLEPVVHSPSAKPDDPAFEAWLAAQETPPRNITGEELESYRQAWRYSKAQARNTTGT